MLNKFPVKKMAYGMNFSCFLMCIKKHVCSNSKGTPECLLVFYYCATVLQALQVSYCITHYQRRKKDETVSKFITLFL